MVQKKEEMLGSRGNFYVEKLHNLYSSPNTIRMIKSRSMELAGHVARMVAKRNAYKFFLGKPEGMRPLGRLRRNWTDDIKRNRETGWGEMDWINFARDRNRRLALMNTIMTLWCL
jgi:hypothetical protein